MATTEDEAQSRAPPGARGRVSHRRWRPAAVQGGRSPVLVRLDGPILEPTGQWWESRAVFNPGVAEGPDGTIHVLYRAQGSDGVSRLGYARTRDGVRIEERRREPVFEPNIHDEFERLGTEDPRIVRLGSTFYITYTAASLYQARDLHPADLSPRGPPWRVRVALARTEDFRTFTRVGIILPDMDNKDAVLFPEKIDGRYVLLHRLPPDVWIATSVDLRRWEEHRVVLRTRPALWDERKLGAGPPPVPTDAGWLLCYHGADHHNVYRAGFALLDRREPSRVLARGEEPTLEPEEPWEIEGPTPRVVFPTGMVRRGDDLFVYYGAADHVVGVAKGSVKEVLASLK